MLNKFLLTALVLMLSHTTVYAWVDCEEAADCVPDLLVRIDGIDQLKARVIVTSSTGIEQECTPIDWVGHCVIYRLSSGIGWYSAKVSFGVTAPLSGFHCDYYGKGSFYFNGLNQGNLTISLIGNNCYYFDDELPPAKE